MKRESGRPEKVQFTASMADTHQTSKTAPPRDSRPIPPAGSEALTPLRTGGLPVYALVTTIGLTLLTAIAITLIFTNRRLTEILRSVRSVDEGVAEVIGMNTRAVSKTITDTGAHRAIRRIG